MNIKETFPNNTTKMHAHRIISLNTVTAYELQPFPRCHRKIQYTLLNGTVCGAVTQRLTVFYHVVLPFTNLKFPRIPVQSMELEEIILVGFITHELMQA